MSKEIIKFNFKEVGFSKVIKALDKGFVASKASWEKKRYVFKLVPYTVLIEDIDDIILLPTLVKKIIVDNYVYDNNLNKVLYKDTYSVLTPNQEILSWLPSIEDLQANDWIIFKH